MLKLTHKVPARGGAAYSPPLQWRLVLIIANTSDVGVISPIIIIIIIIIIAVVVNIVITGAPFAIDQRLQKS